MRRSDQRRDAVFALYQRQVTEPARSTVCSADAKPFTRELAEGTAEHTAEIDAEIGRLSRGWTIDRIAPLELNIMRVALFEIHHRDDIPARSRSTRRSAWRRSSAAPMLRTSSTESLARPRASWGYGREQRDRNVHFGGPR